jgi:hypothetical protein
MKRTKLLSKSVQLSLMVLIIFGSCKKDELESKELLVFVKGEYGSTNSTITASLTRTPNDVWGNKSFEIPTYATRPVTADIDVYIYPDDRFVAQYNQANGTNYLLLPANTYTISTDYRRTIHAGSNSSDPVKLQITNAAALTDTRGYVLPLTITKIDGKDKGAKISNNQATVYIAVPYKYTNVDTVQTVLSGTLLSRTGWSVTVSNSSSGTANQASNILDGNNGTWWRSSNSATAAKSITLTMPAAQQVSGFKFTPNYNSTNENATQMTISSSNDNVTFTVQGIWKGTGPAAGSSSSAPDFKGVNFLVPVTARYWKFDITAWVSTNIVGVGEINAIQ